MIESVPIIERVRLNQGSDKETYHVVLDISNTDLTYSVGDCVAVYPENEPELVTAIMEQFENPAVSVIYKDEALTFHDFLTKRANLVRAPKKLGEGDHVLDALRKCGKITPQELTDLLSPLLPRFYSIASSMSAVGKQIHLTVAVNENPPHFPTKYGTCSHYLCKRAPLFENSIRLYMHPAKDFYLSPASFQKPLIMVGPGTGIAPFRGFIQERLQRGALENWLFFGERRSKHDFYYQSEWEEAQKRGALQIETAFSRDGEEKVYVQDRMLQNSQRLWEWLEKGAYLYVCGDAKRMAKAVEETIKIIIENESSVDSKEYIKNLKSQKRYLRDVY